MVEEIETVWIPMPDGTRLAGKLWLPGDARENPVPAILEYIPYRRRDRTRLRDNSMHPQFAEAGYASIRVDMRGNGDSDGLMLDEYADIETEDGANVIAWLAEQEWCDGNVGMFGKSWGAYNSFQVAALKPPALKAIAPVMGTDDRWLEDIHFYGGVLAGDNFWWGSVMQLYNAAAPDPAVVGDRWREMWKHRLDNMTFWPAMWLEHQTEDAMWRRGSISGNYDDVSIPVYFFGGWADLFRDTPFRIAEHMSDRVKVTMGPWAHLYPHEALPAPQFDFVGEVIRFWDAHLKAKDNGIMDEPRLHFYLEDSDTPTANRHHSPGIWVEESVWPSPNVRTRKLHLNSGSLDDKAQKGADMEITSPQTFGSAAGDMCSFAFPGDMPADCRIDAAGALVFRGEPADKHLCILGRPKVNLRVRASAKQAFAAVLLVDEAPDGAQMLICRGFANFNHRNSTKKPEAVKPGETMNITVPLHGTGYRLAPGHRLMVQVASAYWPVLWPSPEAVTLTMTPGESVLELPVLEKVTIAKRDFPAPAEPEAPKVTSLREGSCERYVRGDLITGEHINRVFSDGGLFGPVGTRRLDETGLEISEVYERIYRIHPDDPLSAHAGMEQDTRFHRDDWSTRIRTTSKMTATGDAFILHATVECWDGEELFHEVEWNHEIKRNFM